MAGRNLVPMTDNESDLGSPTKRWKDIYVTNITGNAATATKLATARTISLTGDVTGSSSFDGSANASITATVADDSHSHDTQYYKKAEAVPSGADLNDYTVPGFYYCPSDVIASTMSNIPVARAFSLRVYESAGVTQHWQGYNTSDVYVRSYYLATGWTPWSSIYHQGNLLGTVSQSGGIPTGAVIERGSNANGEYVKFADGTMICTGLYLGAITGVVAYGAVYTSAFSCTFPATFSAVDCVGISGNHTHSLGWGAARIPLSSATTGYFQLFYLVGGDTAASALQWFAIGRWF